MTIIEILGTHFTWECATGGTASCLYKTVMSAATGYERHMSSYLEREADEEACFDSSECVTRVGERRVTA